jgi:hypothetical protein
LLHRSRRIESELHQADIDRPPYLAFTPLPWTRPLARAAIVATRTTVLSRQIVDLWTVEPAAKPLQLKNKGGTLRTDAAGRRVIQPTLLAIVVRL